MKKVLILALFLFGFQIVTAQELPKLETEMDLYSLSGIEVKPEFQGGMQKFYEFIGKNYYTPNSKEFKGGKVYISFVVEKDGSLSDLKVIRDAGFGTGNEAIRVLKMCPKWSPGVQNGKPVRCTYTLPIVIQSN